MTNAQIATKEYRMQFGKHVPESEKTKRPQSVMSAFARGLSLGEGTEWKFQFPNGYGASVINDGYGGDQGLYELAVLHDGAITYETPLTDAVLGYLSEQQVADALDQIESLAVTE